MFPYETANEKHEVYITRDELQDLCALLHELTDYLSLGFTANEVAMLQARIVLFNELSTLLAGKKVSKLKPGQPLKTALSVANIAILQDVLTQVPEEHHARFRILSICCKAVMEQYRMPIYNWSRPTAQPAPRKLPQSRSNQ